MSDELPVMSPAELRAIRETLKKTQKEMAKALGVGERGYQHWEAGARPISGPAVLLARKLRNECALDVK